MVCSTSSSQLYSIWFARARGILFRGLLEPSAHHTVSATTQDVIDRARGIVFRWSDLERLGPARASILVTHYIIPITRTLSFLTLFLALMNNLDVVLPTFSEALPTMPIDLWPQALKIILKSQVLV